MDTIVILSFIIDCWVRVQRAGKRNIQMVISYARILDTRVVLCLMIKEHEMVIYLLKGKFY